jgi:hypothetical protein
MQAGPRLSMRGTARGRARSAGSRGRGRGRVAGPPRGRGRLDVPAPPAGVAAPVGPEDLPGWALADLPDLEAVVEVLEEMADELGDDLDLAAEAEADDLVDPQPAPEVDDEPMEPDEPVPPPPLPPPPPAATFITGPDELGYLFDTRDMRRVGRLTPVYNKSVAVRCYLHGAACSVPVAEWKLPSLLDIRTWLGEAVTPPVNATADQKRALALPHADKLRARKDAAVWPGRTRQGIIDEARTV